MRRLTLITKEFFRLTGDWLVDCVKMTIFTRLTFQLSMWRPPVIDQLIYENLPSVQPYWDGLFIWWNLAGQLLLVLSLVLLVLELQRQQHLEEF